MRKLIFSVFLIALCLSGVNAQSTMDLSAALDESAWNIASSVPAKSNISVAAIFSDSQDVSSYLVQEMTRRLAQTGKFTVLERGKGQELIDAEMMYQYSGAVDDDSMVGLGHRLGAQYLIYGSFEQYGGMLQLTIQATGVEGGEILYLKSYIITKTSQITDLFDDDMELLTAEDYLDAIARCQKKITSIEKEKSKAVQNQKARILPKYQEQINAARALEKDPWESTAEYNERISSTVAEIEKKRDIELSGVNDSIGISYDNQSEQVEIQREKLIKDLKNITFSISGDSVQVMLGTFDPESKPKGWPVSVKSLDKFVSYTYSGKYVVNDADVKTEYQTVENARSYDGFEGEINYRIVESQIKDIFSLYIASVRVYIKSTGLTIVNESINRVVGQAVASRVVSGTTTTTGTQKTVQSNSSESVTGNTGNAYYGEDGVLYVPYNPSAGYVPVEISDYAWITNNFSIGPSIVIYPEVKIPMTCAWDGGSYYVNSLLGGLCLSLSAFNTTLNWFYVDWLNIDVGFGGGFFVDASVDAGAYFKVFNRFFPFVRVGAGLFYAFESDEHFQLYYADGRKFEDSDFNNSISGIDFFVKGGVGLDVNIGRDLKITFAADVRYGMPTSALGFGVKFGVTFGKPIAQ